MPGVDGDIKLGVSLEPNDIKKSAQELQSEIGKIFEQTSGNTDKSLQTIKNSLSNAYSKAQKLQEELDKLETTQIPTKDYTELEKRLEAENRQFDKLLIKQDEMQELGKDSGKSWEALNIKMEQLGRLIREDESELKSLVESGKAFTLGSTTEQYSQRTQQLAGVNNQMRVLLGRIKPTSSAFSKLGKQIGQATTQLLKFVSKGVQTGINSIRNKIKEIGKATEQSKRIFTSFVKAMIGVSGIYTLFRKLHSAILEGFNNLKEFNGETIKFKDTMEGLKADGTQFKNSIASAFEPLVTTVVPYLQAAANALSDFMAKLAAFNALLTGRNTIIKAKKQTDEYGKAINKAAGSQSKLNAELYGFDTLNRQQDNSGSGGGTDVSNMFEEIEAGALLPEKVKEWIEELNQLWKSGDFEGVGEHIAFALNEGMSRLDDWVNNSFRPKSLEWTRDIKDLLNGLVNGFDWESSGKLFGDGINTFIDIGNTFLGEEGFDFTNLGEGIGLSLREGLDTVKWDELGQLFANDFNALVHFIEGIVTTPDLFDFAKNAVRDAIVGLFSGIDFESIKTVIVTIFNNLTRIVGETDWLQVFNNLYQTLLGLVSWILDVIADLDWVSVGQFIFRALLDVILFVVNPTNILKLVGLLFQGALTVLHMAVSLILGAIAGIASSIADGFRSVGLESIAGLWDGISNALKSVNSWLKEHVVDPIVNGVKKLLGIASPSTVFSDIGGWIIEGLKNGITNMWDKVKNGIFDTFDGLKNKVKDIFGISSPSKVFAEYGEYIDEGFAEGLEEKQSLVTKAVEGLMEQVNDQNAELTPVIDTGELTFNLDSAIEKLATLASWFQNISTSFATISSLPVPALATGGVVPPGAFESGSDNRLNELLNKIESWINSQEERPVQVEVHSHVDLDGREIYNSVVDENNKQIEMTGSSKIRV